MPARLLLFFPSQNIEVSQTWALILQILWKTLCRPNGITGKLKCSGQKQDHKLQQTQIPSEEAQPQQLNKRADIEHKAKGKRKGVGRRVGERFWHLTQL